MVFQIPTAPFASTSTVKCEPSKMAVTSESISVSGVGIVPTLVPCSEPIVKMETSETGDAELKRGSKRPRKETPATTAGPAKSIAEGSPPAEATAKKAATPSGAPKSKKSIPAGSSAPVPPVAVPDTSAAATGPVEGAEQGGDLAEKNGGAENGSWLIVAKTVRTALKNYPTSMHCGADALPALNAKVSELINEAIGRALANNRKTLKSCDF